jgi:uncharacterized protein
LISALFLQSFVLAFGEEPERVPSPATERLQEAQETVRKSEDKEKLLRDIFTDDPQLKVLVFLAVVLFLALTGSGLVLSLFVCARLARGEPMIKAVASHRSIDWGIAEVVKVMILFYFWSLVLAVLFGFANEYIFGRGTENLFVLVHTLIIDGAVLFFIIYFVHTKFKAPLASIGLSKKNILSDIGLGFSSYAVVLPLLITIIAVLAYCVSLINYEPPPHPLVDIFVVEDRRNPFIIYLSLALACTIGPVIEEIFFRGFCYTTFKKYIGPGGAMVLSAVFFAFVHYSVFAFLPVFALGMVLAYLYEKRGTLMASITVHIVHNSLFIGYFFIVKRVLFDTV